VCGSCLHQVSSAGRAICNVICFSEVKQSPVVEELLETSRIPNNCASCVCVCPEGQHDTTQHNTTQHNTTQHNTTQHNTTQHNTTQHNTTHHNTTQHNTTQHNTTQHITAQHNAAQRNTAQSYLGVARRLYTALSVTHVVSLSFCLWGKQPDCAIGLLAHGPSICFGLDSQGCG
jgi:hypothetical protein